MHERLLTAIRTEDPGLEEPAATRQRLKDAFPAGAARRMTQLGMLVGSALQELQPQGDDTIVYASRFGESRALEAFLDSFPGASPTLFQTSIHPSGAQQGLIVRQRATPELFPIAGSPAQLAHALHACLLAPARRALFCGGEERGTWLTPCSAASERAFAFGLALASEPTDGEPVLGRVSLDSCEDSGYLDLAAWFDLVHGRRDFAGVIAPGWRMRLEWSAP